MCSTAIPNPPSPSTSSTQLYPQTRPFLFPRKASEGEVWKKYRKRREKSNIPGFLVSLASPCASRRPTAELLRGGLLRLGLPLVGRPWPPSGSPAEPEAPTNPDPDPDPDLVLEGGPVAVDGRREGPDAGLSLDDPGDIS